MSSRSTTQNETPLDAFRREIAADPAAADRYLLEIDRRIQQQDIPLAAGPTPKERFERWRLSVLASESA